MSKNINPGGSFQSHDYRQTEYIVARLKDLYKSFGYRPAYTPAFEYYDLFCGVEGTVNLDEMIKVIDETGRVLVLRPDVTTPIARAAAIDPSPGYLKSSYATNVFRRGEGQPGGKKEFLQAGVEYLGNSSVEADGEVIALAIKSLLSSGLTNIKIDLGQICYFKGILKELAFSAQQEDELRKLIEKKQFPELTPLIQGIQGRTKAKQALLAVPSLYGPPGEVLERARRHVLNGHMAAALDNLDAASTVLSDYGYRQYLALDLGLVNHLDYYTGIVFKGYAPHHGREILSGGRYDNLTRQYGRPMAATGFGLDVDELRQASGAANVERYYTDFLVLYPPSLRSKGLKLADALRSKGYAVETDCRENWGAEVKARSDVGKIIVVNKDMDMLDIQADGVSGACLAGVRR